MNFLDLEKYYLIDFKYREFCISIHCLRFPYSLSLKDRCRGLLKGCNSGEADLNLVLPNWALD